MKKSLAAAIVILAIAAGGFAQPDKDLFGTWKMDASRSKFVRSGDAPALVARISARHFSLSRCSKVNQ